MKPESITAKSLDMGATTSVQWPGTQSIDEATRTTEYEICQRRGHESGISFSVGWTTRNVCRWCGTTYWSESVQHEADAPEPK